MSVFTRPIADFREARDSERLGRMFRRALGRAFIYIGLLVGLMLFAGPLYWMIASGVKAEGDVFQYPPNFIPQEIYLQNYPDAINRFPLINSVKNTLFVVVMIEIGRLLTSSLAAFGFSRVSFPHRDKIFILVLSTMMIPYHVTLIPQYLIFRDLRLLDSLHPLYIPHLFGGGAFFIFLLRQFFLTIPKDYDDAARIDGCGTFGIYWKIIMPQSLPASGCRCDLHLHVDVGGLPRPADLRKLPRETHRCPRLPALAEGWPHTGRLPEDGLESHHGNGLGDNVAADHGVLLCPTLLHSGCRNQWGQGLRDPTD